MSPAANPLPRDQAQLALRGHAIEVRIYAEDPAQEFRPSIGTLAHLRQPRESASIRVDAGVRQGDAITPYYDPMIAKLIVHGEDRAAAVQRLAAALAEYEVVGVQTNLDLLRAIAAHPAFARAELDTGFIARHAGRLGEPAAVDEALIWAAATLMVLADLHAGAPTQASDPLVALGATDAWRMNGDGYQDVMFEDTNGKITIRAARSRTAAAG